MSETSWKVTAIVFIVLFTLSVLYISFSIVLYITETNNTVECYFDICEEYPQASYESNVCTCYDANENGEYYAVKTKWMGG